MTAQVLVKVTIPGIDRDGVEPLTLEDAITAATGFDAEVVEVRDGD